MNSPLIEEKIGTLLREKGMKLTLAESCTGGLIGHRVTNIAGSSDYYLGSLTAYAYEVKEGLARRQARYFGPVWRCQPANGR